MKNKSKPDKIKSTWERTIEKLIDVFKTLKDETCISTCVLSYWHNEFLSGYSSLLNNPSFDIVIRNYKDNDETKDESTFRFYIETNGAFFRYIKEILDIVYQESKIDKSLKIEYKDNHFFTPKGDENIKYHYYLNCSLVYDRIINLLESSDDIKSN